MNRAAALLLLLAAAPAAGDDWPSFGGGPARNMVSLTKANLPAKWDLRPARDGGHVLWTADLGTRAYAGPVVAGGRVFVGTNNERPRNPRDADPKRINPATKMPAPLDKGVLMCFRAADGRFLWQHVNDKLDDPVAHDWPREGVCSTPWVEGDRLWYVTNRAEVVCLDANGFADGNQGWQDEKYKDATDADVTWSFDMIQSLGVQVHRMAASSPLVVGDLVYVVTGNGVDTDKTGVPNPKAPSFVALNKHTGKLVWSDNSPGANVLHGQWSSPSYGVIGGVPQVVFAGGDGWVRAFEPKTGKPLWRFDVNRKAVALLPDAENRLNHVIAMPVVVNDRVYVGSGMNPESGPGAGDLWCVAPAGKSGDVSAELIEEAAGRKKARPNPNSAVVWHRGASDGEFGRTISTVAVREGLVYSAEIGGVLQCLDADTGREHWRHDLKAAVWGSPLWAGGKVLIADEDGRLTTFRHGRAKELLGATTFDGVFHTSPVAAGGVVYVMTERQLFALQK